MTPEERMAAYPFSGRSAARTSMPTAGTTLYVNALDDGEPERFKQELVVRSRDGPGLGSLSRNENGGPRTAA